MKPWPTLLAFLLGAAPLAAVPPADPPPADPSALTIVDANGKAHALKAWKLVAGTRRLGWLAPAAPARGKAEKPSDKPKPADAGTECLVFRDDNSTTLVDGVLTFLPLDHLSALEYDGEKQTVTANVLVDRKAPMLALTGSTKYAGINKVTIEAEVDKGAAGIAAVKYQGGAAKGGARAIRFPTPKPAPEVKGRPAFVSIADKETKHAEQVFDLQPLYRLGDGGERLLPVLLFKKTLKLEVAKIARLRATARDEDGTECGVTTKDGEEQTYTLLKTATIDGKAATLEALVGKVRGGYKFYPASTLASMHLDVQFDEKK